MAETAQADSWWGGMMDNASDIFGAVAGTWLEYEKIQAGADAGGSSQSSVNGQPETSSQVQQPLNPQPVLMGLSATQLMMGAAALAAVVLLVKK